MGSHCRSHTQARLWGIATGAVTLGSKLGGVCAWWWWRRLPAFPTPFPGYCHLLLCSSGHGVGQGTSSRGPPTHSLHLPITTTALLHPSLATARPPRNLLSCHVSSVSLFLAGSSRHGVRQGWKCAPLPAPPQSMPGRACWVSRDRIVGQIAGSQVAQQQVHNTTGQPNVE